jgi:hypothetical protein
LRLYDARDRPAHPSGRNGRDAERGVRVAGVFVGSIHQHICAQIAGIGVEDQIELYAVSVADDRDVVIFGPVQQIEPEYSVEIECAIEIAHPNADVIDAFDRDCLVPAGYHAEKLLI